MRITLSPFSVYFCDDGESSQFKIGFAGALLWFFTLETSQRMLVSEWFRPTLYFPIHLQFEVLPLFCLVHYFASSSPHFSRNSDQCFALTGSKEIYEGRRILWELRMSHLKTRKRFHKQARNWNLDMLGSKVTDQWPFLCFLWNISSNCRFFPEILGQLWEGFDKNHLGVRGGQESLTELQQNPQ